MGISLKDKQVLPEYALLNWRSLVPGLCEMVQAIFICRSCYPQRDRGCQGCSGQCYPGLRTCLLRICKNCHESYPYLHPSNVPASSGALMDPGWLDRLHGRDCIAIPCTRPASSNGYICSNCSTCAQAPINGECNACPAFVTGQDSRQTDKGRHRTGLRPRS